jgi:glyoxylase-like metal-dependent hydrolase (beta-lactamase superfamily II)
MAYALEDEFGDIIGKARRGLGLNAAVVAEQVGVSADDLDKMESYELTPEQAVIDRLAGVLGLDSARLGAIAREEWEPSPSAFTASDAIDIKRFLVQEYNANVYLLVNKHTQTALLVDAGGLGGDVVQHVRNTGVRLLAILITHGHSDHTDDVDLVRQQTGADVYVHGTDIAINRRKLGADPHGLEGNEALEFEGFNVQVVSTPGHTAGSVTLVVEKAAFTGDTLFSGSMGRCSLVYPEMLQTIRENVLTLPAATGLYPGHGPSTTVQEERDHNPFFG